MNNMRKLLPLFIGMALGSFSYLATADDLVQVYNQAKENDPQLLKAAATKNAAFEAVNSSQSSLLPQINLNAGYNLTRNVSGSNSFGSPFADNNRLSAGVSLSQQLYQRSSWVNLDISEKTARQADFSYAAEQQGVILRVVQAYLDVLRANDNLEFIRAEKAAVARQLEQTKQRFDVGLSAITDVYDAQAQYDSVLANEVLTKNQLVNSYEDLRVITGTGHTSLNVLNTVRFSASPSGQSSTDLIDEAKKKNLSLLAARVGTEIAKENITLADSGHMPSLTFDASYDYADVSGTPQGAGNGRGSDITAGLNLVVPLYSGGNTTSLTEQAKSQFIAASQDLEATYRDVTKNVRAYNNNINASIGALKAYEQAVISAKSALKATEAGFDVGTRTIVDVLDSTQNLYNANRNLANARYDYILSVLQLKQAIGTLSEQDIVNINAGLRPNKTTQSQ